MKAKAVLSAVIALPLLACAAVWAQTPPDVQPVPSEEANANNSSAVQTSQVVAPAEQSKDPQVTERKEIRKGPNGETIEETVRSSITPDGKHEEKVVKVTAFSSTQGQPPGCQPDQLPEELPDMIAAALRNNADIQVAEARLRLAEAELRRTRQEVAGKTAETFQELNWARDHAKECQQRFDNGSLPSLELMTAMRELAGLESRLRSLVGLMPEAQPQGMDSRAPGDGPLVPSEAESTPPDSSAPAARVTRPPIPDRYKEVLDKPITFRMGEDNELKEMLQWLSAQTGIQFVGAEEVAGWPPTALLLEQTPLRQVLEAISEVADGQICFLFRDYGVLVVKTARGQRMPGPMIPEYIPYTES